MAIPILKKKRSAFISLLNCRLRDSMSMTDTSNKRYIITAPPSDFILFPSDLVFVLMQFDHGTEYQPLLAGGRWMLTG